MFSLVTNARATTPTLIEPNLTKPGKVAVGEQVATVRQALANVRWHRAADSYRATTTGSNQPEAETLAQLDAQIQRQLDEAEQLVGGSATALAEIINRLQGQLAPPAKSAERMRPA